MYKIIPSSPFKNYSELENFTNKFKGFGDKLQIDICDGKYVKNISWPFAEFTLESFKKPHKEDKGELYLPNWENFIFSADLMCENVESYFESLVYLGFEEFIIHFNSIFLETEEKTFNRFVEIINFAKKYEITVFLAIDLNTDLIKFYNFMKFLERDSMLLVENFYGIQITGIKNIGVSGQNFDVKVLEVAKQIKEKFSNFVLQIDGGVNDGNILELKKVGFSNFCVGSFLTQKFDAKGNFQILKDLLK